LLPPKGREGRTKNTQSTASAMKRIYFISYRAPLGV
jgi:hypothetical protein